GIIRYTSSKDAERILRAVSAGSLAMVVINLITFYSALGMFVIPFSILVIDYLATSFIMIGSRVFVKTLYLEMSNPAKSKQDVIIYGAGEAGVIAKRTLDRDAGSKYNVVAFIDDNINKSGKMLEGVKIHASDKLENLLIKNKVPLVIISIQNINASRKKKVIDVCLNKNVRVLTVPPVKNWINGMLSFRQIQRIRIEDLLERDPILLDKKIISQQIEGKNILVTGGAGSIGSELARQICQFNPGRLILLDQAESPLYNLELELLEKYKLKNVEIVLGDIRSQARMENLFKTFPPDVIYHAAAYKHVPCMENNPSEAVMANIKGTKIIADLAIKYEVSEFVFVSTDKAVNPTNVMGASKRISEIYVQSLSKSKKETNFITTRFGNVLGSNGSVILRFKEQIEKGGPVTVTDPQVRRYFMTIPEACQLVLEAGAIGKGGDIYIFDMGKSMKIDDLARNMIKLSKLEINKDIQLVYTGLRPGEKLVEELLNSKENTIPTHHPKIMIANVREYDWNLIEKETNELIAMFDQQNNEQIVKKMKEIVPEYKSSNSIYEKLDTQKS
ncbi:MAG TPA: polysaccharide biosynthesis protein, partial [Flavobacteriales bacterium]|nr:polysaccharide biosynthesis protein [Flavobacteriales bacterium]